MDAHEKAALLKQLENGKTAILEALHGVSAEVSIRKPAPGKWSILECIEHVVVSEDYLFAQILAATPADAPVKNEKRESAIPTRGLDRTRTIESPEMAKPAGRFSTLNGALRQFLALRERTIRFVETCDGDLRAQITTHPLFGSVNCYETLLMIAMHSLRHVKQIEECKPMLL
ncbi:MAG: DinB family protein [Acidobacteriota bacterium]|nr:DinB family protein [Acidobacteriota bacterium]